MTADSGLLRPTWLQAARTWVSLTSPATTCDDNLDTDRVLKLTDDDDEVLVTWNVFCNQFFHLYVHLDSWDICGEDIITWKSDQLKMLFEGMCPTTFFTWFCHLYLYPPQKTFHWYLLQQPGQDKSNNLFIFSTLSDLIAADCLQDKLTFSGRFFIINIKLCLVRNCSCTLYFFALIFSLKGLHPHRTRNRFCWKSSSFSCLK